MRAIDEKKIPRRQSKKDLAEALLKKLDDWITAGDTVDEAIEKLSVRQYDFLAGYQNGEHLDNLMLTTEQRTAIKTITKSPRIVKPGGYNKKYPQSKQELYNNLVAFIEAQGAEIIPREKNNYRDLDFTLNGTLHKIVLSNSRTKK